jgi:outer membrane biosynthesis protein TonB
MRPTVGQILSGLALGTVAASMLVMPERFLGAEDVAVQRLVLQAPAERTVVRAAPIPPRRLHRPPRVNRPVKVVARPAPVTVTISHRVPTRPGTEHPQPPPPPAHEVVPEPPPPSEAPAPPPAAPPPAPPPAAPSPAAEIASVCQTKNKAKNHKPRKDKKPKKCRHDEHDDKGDEARGGRDQDRHDDDDKGKDKGKDH